MTTPQHPPKKPAGQGGKAPANVQPVNAWEKPASNTSGIPSVSNTANNWQDHARRSNPGGVGGSRKK